VRAPASDLNRWRWRWAAAGAAAALVAGCGGRDDAAKRDYVRRADGVCVVGRRAVAGFPARLAAAQRGTDPGVIFRQLGALTAAEAAARQPELDQLGALVPPANDDDAVKAWVAERRRQQSLLRGLAAAFGRHDDAAISRLSQQIAALAASTAAFARRYGLSACAQAVGGRPGA
jgi:hypothetical protein